MGFASVAPAPLTSWAEAEAGWEAGTAGTTQKQAQRVRSTVLMRAARHELHAELCLIASDATTLEFAV